MEPGITLLWEECQLVYTSAFRLSKRVILILCGIAICCLTAPTNAQYHFQSWSTDDGLPQNTIRAIRQTRDGYLWLATNDGLARFDGFKFVVFDSAYTPGFCCNRLMNLYETADGSLWIAPDESRLIRYHDHKFESPWTFPESGSVNNRLLQEDKQGNLLVSTAAGLLVGRPPDLRQVNNASDYYYLDKSGSLWYSTPGRLIRSKDNHEDFFLLPGKATVRVIYEGADGFFWIATAAGLLKLSPHNSSPVLIKNDLPTTVINAIIEDRKGNLWFGTDHGLGRLRGDEFSIFTTVDGLSSNAIISLLVDREDTLWIGTADQGLNKLVPNVVKGIGPNASVYPVFEARDGTIWIGTWPEGIFTLRDGKLARVNDQGRSFATKPLAFAEDTEGRLWIGSMSGIWWYKDGKYHDVSDGLLKEAIGVHAVFQDRRGVLWFGSDQGLFGLDKQKTTLYTTKDGLAGNEIKVLLEDRLGQLWIGTKTGLSRMSGGSFVSYTKKDGLASDHIRDLRAEDDGTIWIGTFDGGLSRIKDDRVISTYTPRDGLFAKGAFRILDDDRGNLWLSSNTGIYRVSKQQLDDFTAGKTKWITSVAYGRKEGMPNVECNGGSQPAGVRTQDGKLLFATQQGVAMIDLREVDTNQQPPRLVIESVTANLTPQNLGANIELPYNAGNLEIRYVGLNSIRPESTRYKYKLEGFDHDWIDAGNSRVANYPRLTSGNYKFFLAASNSDGVWSIAEPKFAVVVAAPFWNTWWFVVAATLAMLGICYTIYRIYMLKFERDLAKQQALSRQLIESQETERRRIARELHDDVVQRLVSLGISTFNLTANLPEKLRGQLMEIYDRTMGVTDDIRKLSHSLHPAVLQYIGLVTAIRSMCNEFDSRNNISVSLLVDEHLKTFDADVDLCLYRIVQQSLTNVAQHAEASSVLVSLLPSGSEIELLVSDDGKGFDREETVRKGGLGLVSLEERVNMLGGQFEVRSRDGSGTEVFASLPLGRSRNK